MSDGAKSTKEDCKQAIANDLIKSLQDLSVRNSSMSFNIANSLIGISPTSDNAKEAESPPPQGILPQMIQSLKETRQRIIDANRNLEEVQTQLGI